MDGEIIDDEAGDGQPRYLPDLETIRRECLAIQSEWSPQERLRRTAVKPSRELDYGRVVRIGD